MATSPSSAASSLHEGRTPGRSSWTRLWPAWLAVLPALLLTAGLLWWPMVQVVWYSLTDFDGFLGVGSFVGLSNYANALTDSAVRAALVHSLVYAFFYIIVQLVVAFLLSVAMTSVARGSNVYRAVVFTPVVISPVAAAFAWTFLYDPNNGAINGLLDALGLESLAQNWLGNYDLALLSVIVVDLWKNLGFFLVIFLAGLSTVPVETTEAAKMDGANGWQVLIRVTVPQLRLTIGLALVLAINGAVRAFDTVYLMTQGGPGHATDVFMTKTFREAFANQNFGYGSALAVMALIALIVVAAAQRRLSRET